MSPLLRKSSTPIASLPPEKPVLTGAPSPFWTAETILRLVQGHCLHEQNWGVAGLACAVQDVRPGFLFIALPDAPEGDGHERTGEAAARGAAAAIVERAPPRTPAGFPLIYVESSRAALRALQAAPDSLNSPASL